MRLFGRDGMMVQLPRDHQQAQGQVHGCLKWKLWGLNMSIIGLTDGLKGYYYKMNYQRISTYMYEYSVLGLRSIQVWIRHVFKYYNRKLNLICIMFNECSLSIADLYTERKKKRIITLNVICIKDVLCVLINLRLKC